MVCSIINQPFFGYTTPIYGNTHIRPMSGRNFIERPGAGASRALALLAALAWSLFGFLLGIGSIIWLKKWEVRKVDEFDHM